MPAKTSALPDFRSLSPADRRRLLEVLLGLDAGSIERDLEGGGLDEATAAAMVENAIGTIAVPFGVALNVRVNGADYLVPMAVEEPSVVAATSHAAKRVRAGGGFEATADAPEMIAQIEVHDVADAAAAIAAIEAEAKALLADVDRSIPGVRERGGGARELTVRDLGDGFVVAHVVVDCCDAMGANVLNTAAEAIGPRVAELAKGELGLRILSNYADRRCVRVKARVPIDALGCARSSGAEAARGVELASRFAEKDVYRAVTHNKGIMNGVDAVALATGNDLRAIEAAAHAYASRSGRYAPLATWRVVDGALEGKLEMPLAVGVVGGALRAHRGARLALAIAGVRSAAELAMVAAATGLATNLSALRALSTEGIQRGHMSLHHRAASINRG